MLSKWTPALDEELRKLTEEGLTVGTIAKRLSVPMTPPTVRTRVNKLEIPRNAKYRSNVPREVVDKAFSLYTAGGRLPQIAKDLGIAYMPLYRAMVAAGMTMKTSSEAARHYECNRHFFDVIDTEEKAYWLGFIMADGCIAGKHTLKIGLASKDREHLQTFLNHIEATNPILDYTSTLNGTKCFTSIVAITSAELTRGLALHGVHPRKSFTCEWPANLPEELEHHFIRGYVDGDGSFSLAIKKQALNFNVIGSTAFIPELQARLMAACNLSQTKISPKKPGSPVVVTTYGGNRQVARIAKYLYRDATVYLERKRAVVRPFEHLADLPIFKLTDSRPWMCKAA